MIITSLVVAGVVAFPQLGVDRYPNMDLPSVYVRTVYPGAASAEVESEVSQVIEDAVAVSGPRPPSELFLMADRYVKNVIESAPGVGQVTIAGAADRAVQINIDARRLASYHLSILQVRDALSLQNAEVPGGRVDEGL